MTNDMTKAAFATAAAALFATACAGGTPEASEPVAAGDTVKCLGAHECKGQSQCGVEGGHGCAGQNECKGKGWVKLTQSDCEAKGGTVM